MNVLAFISISGRKVSYAAAHFSRERDQPDCFGMNFSTKEGRGMPAAKLTLLTNS
jgi:hypothetical protein